MRTQFQYIETHYFEIKYLTMKLTREKNTNRLHVYVWYTTT